MFSSREASRWQGEPIDLLILQQSTLIERYTSGDRPVMLDGSTYYPLAFERSDLADSPEAKQNELTITVPSSAAIVGWWRPYAPNHRVFVTLLGLQAGDTEADVLWSGRAINPIYGQTKTRLVCEPSRSNSHRASQQRKWCRGCTKVLYECGVSREDHELAATLADVDGLTLTATAFGTLPNGRLAGGDVEWERPDGVIAVRSIVSHNGESIVINYGGAGLADGLDVLAWPGCKQTEDDCNDYFENGVNFGGYKWLPRQDLFGGDPVR